MGPGTGIVAREAELDEVERVLGAGGPQVLVISGEPGIGKTRLLSELARRAIGRHQTVLSGRGSELEGEVPFAALIEALDDYLVSFGPRVLAGLGERLPDLAAVFPCLRGQSGSPSVAVERYPHHRAIRALLGELAAARPLVLMLDDLQWVDTACAEAIAHLIRSPPDGHVLLAVAHRTTGLPAPISAAITGGVRAGSASEVRLEPLGAEQADLLLVGLAEPVRARIVAESGGNPFFLEQLARSAATNTARRPPAPRGGSAVEVPPAVAAAIAHELRALSPDARRMLEGAAVLREPFDPELAARAAGIAAAGALDLLDEIVARDLARAEPVPRLFRFRHPLVRRAVYDATPPGRRISAHRHAAQALAETGGPVSARAHHHAIGARPGDESAIAVLIQAAAEVAVTAPASAAHWLASALLLVPGDQVERRLALLGDLAAAQAAAGRLADARQSLSTLSDALAPGCGAWAAAVARLASVDLELGQHPRSRRRLESALETVDGHPAHSGPLLLALAMDLAYQAEWIPALSACERALADALAAADSGARVAARAALALTLEGAGRIEESRACRELASAELDGLSDRELSGCLDAAYHLGITEFFLERYEHAARHLQRGVSVAVAHGNGEFLVPTRTWLAYCLLVLGRIDEAIGVAQEAVESGRVLGIPSALAWALAINALAWSVVDAREVLRLGEEALAILDGVQDSIIADATRAHFAWACANAGDDARCIELITLAGAPTFERFEPGRRCQFNEVAVRAAVSSGRVDEAREWLKHGEQLARGLDLPVAVASIQRARALVLIADGNPHAAAQLALQASQAAGDHAATLEAAHSRLVAARALAAAGNRAQAIAELLTVRAETNDQGARRIAQQAARELRALGSPTPTPVPRRRGDSGTRQLTTREQQITDLVAQGHTNAEIARVLYLSPKTIEGNLSRIFAKLGVRSRAHLAATITAQTTDTEQAH